MIAEGEVPCHIGSAVRRQRYLNEGSTCFLLCIQSGTAAHRMIPLTFRVGLPINPTAKLPLDVPDVCLLDSFKLTININCVLIFLPPMRCYLRSACSTPWVDMSMSWLGFVCLYKLELSGNKPKLRTCFHQRPIDKPVGNFLDWWLTQERPVNWEWYQLLGRWSWVDKKVGWAIHFFMACSPVPATRILSFVPSMISLNDRLSPTKYEMK